MALFMSIDGLDQAKLKGSATIKKINDEEGFMKIDSINYERNRPINIRVGDANTAQTGQVELSDITVTRQMDGASSWIQTLFFTPRGKERNFKFVVAKTSMDGKSQVPALGIVANEGRLTSYAVSATEEERTETFTITYTSYMTTHYQEGMMGKIDELGKVGFDKKVAALTSEKVAG
ncbi:MAG: type VI secretion system tube protein Hcp [Planktomarina sp.]|nr:type VI secretion system tube protein Hcp [Planktomarina sp.]|tara:strand:- start:198 stop:728 length:531 start_codon:yes stop_codon:yes gene_type:complete